MSRCFKIPKNLNRAYLKYQTITISLHTYIHTITYFENLRNLFPLQSIFLFPKNPMKHRSTKNREVQKKAKEINPPNNNRRENSRIK